MANHIRWSKVVHDEFELALLYPLAHLLSDTGGTHLWGLVIGGNALVGWDKILRFISLLKREDLLDTTVEEECDVSVLLSLRDVDLLNTLGAQCLGQNVSHVLGLESNREGVIELVLGHGGEVDVLWVWEVLQWRTIEVSEQLSDLSDTVRSVVEEEYFVAI